MLPWGVNRLGPQLPAIAADIRAEPISLKLALTAYSVALAIFIPLSGWMADGFGAKNVFRIAIVVFMAGSISCACSDSLAGGVLETASNLHGGDLGLADFHLAWFVVAAVAISSAIPFMRLPPDAGSDVSGHKAKPIARPVPATS